MSAENETHRSIGRIQALFDLSERVAVITGGAGLLGLQHAAVVKELGAVPILLDIDKAGLENAVSKGIVEVENALTCDITSPQEVDNTCNSIMSRFGRIDVLINNAANNPKAEGQLDQMSRLETFGVDQWWADINVGLTGAFLCSQRFGLAMLENKKGVILNMSSDLGIISPDQRIYVDEDFMGSSPPVKPVTYSVVKAGLIGLTKYLATYWAPAIRVNALAPGGVEANQEAAFVKRLTNLIPLGRMAYRDEYQAAVAFMISDASSYMTGAVVSVDGGRTTW